jgi:hypothetical protein
MRQASNQIDAELGLIAEQLTQIDPDTSDCAVSTDELVQVIGLAGQQLRDAEGVRHLARAQALEALEALGDAIDQINRRIFQATLELDATTGQRELGMRHVLISRSMERIGDNAVDIGEHAAFLVTTGETKRLVSLDACAWRPRSCRMPRQSPAQRRRPRVARRRSHNHLSVRNSRIRLNIRSPPFVSVDADSDGTSPTRFLLKQLGADRPACPAGRYEPERPHQDPQLRIGARVAGLFCGGTDQLEGRHGLVSLAWCWIRASMLVAGIGRAK